MKNKNYNQHSNDLSSLSKEELISLLLKAEAATSAAESKIQEAEDKAKMFQEQYELLLEKMKLATKHKFGSKSETAHALQMSLFNEIEEAALDTEESLPLDILIDLHNHSKKRKARKPSTAVVLDIVDVIHDIEEEDKEGYILCGEKTREELCYQPAKYYVKMHRYPVYKRELEDGTTDFRSADGFQPLIANSYVSGELAAHIMYDKYQRGMPLYRLEHDFLMHDIAISRQTMANWCMRLSEDYFSILVERMKIHLLQKDIIHSDDTSVKVIHHQDGSENQKSTMWVYCSGQFDVPILLYEYQPDRKSEHPKEYLSNFHGYLCSDGYQGYDKVEGVTRVGCLAHARRKFTDALAGYGKNNTSESKRLLEDILKRFSHIFHIDKQLSELELEAKQAERMAKLKPVMEELKQKLTALDGSILRKSKFGEAITYTLNQFPLLENVFLDPRLELTNNRAERQVKPFVMGRKAWLFSNTTRGAKCSADIYSMVQTAKENQLKVPAYLAYVLEEMRGKTITDVKQFDYLLPYSKDLPDSLRMK